MNLRQPLPLLALVISSCFLGPRAPTVEPSRSLDLPSDSSPRPAMKGPFGVAFSSPQGEVQGEAEVNVVFNRPMRALDLAGSESSAPATLAFKAGGAPKGSWRWLGSQALTFVPESQLPDASEYVVTVPAGTAALSGEKLDKAFVMSFSTRRPKLEGVEVLNKNGDEDQLLPTSNFEVSFNQAMDLKTLRNAVRLSVTSLDNGWKEHDVPFTLARTSDQVFTLAPSAPLPLAAKVTVRTSADLRGASGPLPSGKEELRDFETYGLLVAQHVQCGSKRNDSNQDCDPSGGIRLEFNNPVRVGELKNVVRIDPPLAVKWPSESYNTSSYWLSARPAPRTRYRVSIAPGLHDKFGQTLNKASSFEVAMGDEDPSLRVGMQGRYFEAKRPPSTRVVPIGTINVDAYDLSTAALSEEALVTLLTEDKDRYARFLSMAKTERVVPASTPNRMSVRQLSLDSVAKSGALAFGTEARLGRNQRNSREVYLASISDLAITARLSRFGSMVWVSRLSNGAFVPSASVSIRDEKAKVVFSGKTDASGMLVIPPELYAFNSTHPHVMIARLGEDWTYQETREDLDTWRFGRGLSRDLEGVPALRGMLITDRGVYRPGETVRTKVYFREPVAKGTSTPVGRLFTLQAEDNAGNVVFEKKDVRLGAFGEASVDVAIPQTAPLGELSLSARPDDGVGVTTASVLLAAYKAAEFKVAVEPEKPSYIRGDTASFAVRGDYLFGAPMSGSSAKYYVNHSVTHYSPPGLEDYTVGDSTYQSELRTESMHGGATQNGKGTLDNKGTFAVKVPLGNMASGQPETIAVEGEVQDLSRQTQSSESAVLVHPAMFYLGLKGSDEGFVTAPSVYRTKVLAADIKGTVRPGVNVHFDLIARTYATSMEDTGDGYGRAESRAIDKIVRSCELLTAAAPSGCDLPIDTAGYYIVRATARDERGNLAASSTALYASGGEARVAWDWQERNALGLVIDKQTYEPGQTARILVKSPFKEADALVTIERAGVYEQKRIHVSGAMPVIPIPVTEAMRPNAFVAVQLIRGRDAEPKGNVDLAGPGFRLGYVNVSVNPEGKRLAVKASPSKQDAKPGETISVDLQTKDRTGKGVASDVTLYVVDEGVLMLTGYKVPDPIPVFGQARPLNVAGYETRDSLAKLLRIKPGVGVDKGEEGGGGGAEGSVRSDFRATAHFESVHTNAEGTARVSVKLPDSLTSYRVMAVAAAADDRFGFAENNVVTSKPLMGRPALPRFLRAGDRAQAGVIVSSKGLPASTVSVSLDAEGVAVDGVREKTITLPASGSMEVAWPVTATAPGEAKFFFKVRGPVGGDDVVVKRTIQVPMSPETVALYGETETASAERLGALANARSDFGSLDLRVSTTALVGLESSMEALMEYPYGCTEQMTSRLVPYLLMQEFAKLYGFSLGTKPQKSVDDALEKILKNQRSDGGFGWWADSTQSDAWLSSYALWGLGVAAQKGRPVPNDALKNATTYLRTFLGNEKERTSLETKAFIVDVLADRGTFEEGAISDLLSKRDKVPLMGQAYLAHTLALSKKRPAELKAVVLGLEQHVRQTETAAVLVEEESRKSGLFVDSDARLTALGIRAFIAADPEHPMAARLARGLLNMRKRGAWRSTVENASALVALEDFRRAQESKGSTTQARTFLGKILLEEFNFGGSSHSKTASVPMRKAFDAGGETLAFQSMGGKVYYEARLRYSPKDLPSAPMERGFYVQKWVRAVTPDALEGALKSLPRDSSNTLHGGDLVLIDVVVVATDPQEQVVVDDPLPAGLEGVDSRLLGVGSAAARVDEGSEEDPEPYAWFHREVRDDRVLTFVEHMSEGTHHYRYLARATSPGTYVVPPTKVECMYAPETFGRTAGGTMVVQAR